MRAHARKHPIVGSGVAGFTFPLLQHVSKVRDHRDGFHGGLRLAVADDTVDNGSHYVNFSAVKVQVLPAEAEQLALTETRGRIHKDQDTRQCAYSAQKLPDFITRKDVRYRAAFRALAYEEDRVAVKEFVSGSMIK